MGQRGAAPHRLLRGNVVMCVVICVSSVKYASSVSESAPREPLTHGHEVFSTHTHSTLLAWYVCWVNQCGGRLYEAHDAAIKHDFD